MGTALSKTVGTVANVIQADAVVNTCIGTVSRGVKSLAIQGAELRDTVVYGQSPNVDRHPFPAADVKRT